MQAKRSAVARLPCQRLTPAGPVSTERHAVEQGEMSHEELQALKREEAVERLRLIAMGTSGAWIWPPNARIMKVERPDERWQCELELAGG